MQKVYAIIDITDLDDVSIESLYVDKDVLVKYIDEICDGVDMDLVGDIDEWDESEPLFITNDDGEKCYRISCEVLV